MSIEAIARVLNLPMDDPSAKLVLIGIANHTSPTNECFPSVSTLMRYSGLAESTVRAVIKRLEDAGYITVKRIPGTSNRYYLCLDFIEGVLRQEKGGGPDTGGGVVQQPDPNRNSNRKPNASDARADLPDDWMPSSKTLAKIDKAYPSIDITEQAKLFVLANRAKGNVLVDPDAAFEVWMMRAPTLKTPPKARQQPTAAAPGGAAVAAANRLKLAKMKDGHGDWQAASETYIEAAKMFDEVPGHDDWAQHAAALAHGCCAKGSWHAEQAKTFIARRWGEQFAGTSIEPVKQEESSD